MQKSITYPALCILALLSSSSVAVTQAGKTIIAKGQVQASQENTASRDLKRRSPIFDIDKVATGEQSKAQFRMSDGSLFALKQSTTLLVSEYNYAPAAENNSMVVELVEGGLRSVTGAIKANNGSFEMKTPVGSIGIRGTHFEVEIVDGNMFLAVWDGAIDLTVDTGTGSDTVSFGEGEDFSFGIVSSEGEVTQLLEAPDTFSEGHSTETNEQATTNTENNEQQSSNSPGSTTESSGFTSPPPQTLSPDTLATTSPPTGSENTSPDDEQDVQQQVIEEVITTTTPTSPDVVAARTGQFTFNRIVESSLTSTGGQANGLQISMTVDFDNGLVPQGQLTASDSGGEWFAAFNGIINTNRLDLGVNFATHGNELADGDISALFTDNANKLSGAFELFEINNANTRINGSFLIE